MTDCPPIRQSVLREASEKFLHSYNPLKNWNLSILLEDGIRLAKVLPEALLPPTFEGAHYAGCLYDHRRE
jgi:hypothetical protein